MQSRPKHTTTPRQGRRVHAAYCSLLLPTGAALASPEPERLRHSPSANIALVEAFRRTWIDDISRRAAPVRPITDGRAGQYALRSKQLYSLVLLRRYCTHDGIAHTT